MKMLKIDVEPYVFLQTSALTLVDVVFPQILLHQLCIRKYNSSMCASISSGGNHEQENYVQTQAGYWTSVIAAVTFILSVIVVLFLGPLADVIGKKRTMLFIPIFLLLEGLSVILLYALYPRFHPSFLIIAAVFQGLACDNQGITTLSAAYKADATKTEERTSGMASIQGANYLGGAIFSVLSGVFVKAFGFIAIGFIGFILSFLNILYVIVLLPKEKNKASKENSPLLEEELTPALKEKEDGKKRIDVFKLKAILSLNQIKLAIWAHSERTKVLLSIFVYFLIIGPVSTVIPMTVLYLRHSIFDASSTEIGYFAALFYLSISIGNFFLLPFFKYCFVLSDSVLIITGLSTFTIFLIWIALAKSILVLGLSLLILPFAVLAIPGSLSQISKNCPPDLQASAMAATEAVEALATLVSVLLSGLIYAKTVSFFPPLVFYAMSSFPLLGIIVALVMTICIKNNNTIDLTKADEELK